MKYLADENIPRPLAAILSIFEDAGQARHAKNDAIGLPRHAIEHITKHFSPGTKDEIWIPAVGSWPEKPVVICGDGCILRNPILKKLARDADLTFVIMAEGFMNLEWSDQAWKMMKAWPDIVKETRKLKRASIFDVKIRNFDVCLRHETFKLE